MRAQKDLLYDLVSQISWKILNDLTCGEIQRICHRTYASQIDTRLLCGFKSDWGEWGPGPKVGRRVRLLEIILHLR